MRGSGLGFQYLPGPLNTWKSKNEYPRAGVQNNCGNDEN